MNPLLIVDIQPAYKSGFVAQLVRDALAEIEARIDHTPVMIMSVNEEFSGDTPADIREFWLEYGLPEESMVRIRFVEKEYGFYRGWLDSGTPEDEIIDVSRHMAESRIWDSRAMDPELLEALAPWGSELCDPLFQPDALEPLKVAKEWDVCGGGANECLKEVELWCEARHIATQRLDHIVYGH